MAIYREQFAIIKEMAEKSDYVLKISLTVFLSMRLWKASSAGVVRKLQLVKCCQIGN